MKRHERPSGDPSEEFREALRDGRFILQQCLDCARFRFPPAARCDGCGATEWRWKEPTGRGVVHAVALDPLRGRQKMPYSVATIALEEGPLLLGRVMDVAPGDIEMGMPVSAHVALVEGEHAIVFYNKEQGSQEW